jgi:hypothetical protein
MEGSSITTQTLRARVGDQGLAWVAVVVIPPFLIAPALWNGYPLLQWDTGGYLARWYEGYGPRPLDRVRASICITARVRASGSISAFRRWRRSGSCN